ncbi:MAG TPA: hypothetical protein VGE72_12460 [Azospirillum sp.]
MTDLIPSRLMGMARRLFRRDGTAEGEADAGRGRAARDHGASLRRLATTALQTLSEAERKYHRLQAEHDAALAAIARLEDEVTVLRARFLAAPAGEGGKAAIRPAFMQKAL